MSNIIILVSLISVQGSSHLGITFQKGHLKHLLYVEKGDLCGEAPEN